MKHAPAGNTVLVIGAPTPEIHALIKNLEQGVSVAAAHAWEDAEVDSQKPNALILAEYRILRHAGKTLSDLLATFPESFWILLLDPAAPTLSAETLAQKNVYACLRAPWKAVELSGLTRRALEHYNLLRKASRPGESGDNEELPKDAESDAKTDSEALYNELRETLNKIVHSEKMTMLGKMVAGIAHEINTPSGAINAASVNMTHHLKLLLNSLDELEQQGFRREHFQCVMRILQSMVATLDDSRRKSPSEVRTQQREISDMLQHRDVAAPYKTAKDIARMGLGSALDEILFLAENYRLENVLQFFLHCSRIINSAKDIQLSIDILTNIIQALKSYSYPKHDNPELADIHESINTALTLLNNQLKHQIEVDYRPADLPRIICYPSDLSHVWINLLHNAIQALGERGQLKIETFAEARHVGVRITDNGAGIPAEIQAKIFDANFTTKERGQGTGLGLYIALQIVKQHGGDMTVRSVPGETAFEVRLPIR